MNIMRELNFVLALQIKQSQEWIFISQSKYSLDLVKKYGLEKSKDSKISMSYTYMHDKYEDGKKSG